MSNGQISIKYLKNFAATAKVNPPLGMKYIIPAAKDDMKKWADIFSVQYNGEEEFEAGDCIVTAKGLPHE